MLASPAFSDPSPSGGSGGPAWEAVVMGFVFAAFLLGVPLALAVWDLTQTGRS